jgi:hypothetical protein
MGRGDKVCSRCGRIIRTFEFSLDEWATADELWRRIDAAFPATLRRPQLRQYLRSGRLQAGLLEMIDKTERVSPVCRCTWDNEDSVRFDREGKLYLKPSSDARNPLSNPGWLVFCRKDLDQLLSVRGSRTTAAPADMPTEPGYEIIRAELRRLGKSEDEIKVAVKARLRLKRNATHKDIAGIVDEQVWVEAGNPDRVKMVGRALKHLR